MLAFVTREGLGSGPNLSCTVLYLGLVHVVSKAGAIAAKVNVLLDNTAADNKNNEMIFFLAWLVAMDVTDEASFFCMLKGHTYSRIDQTFRTLIGQLIACPVWTVTLLVQYIRQFLQPYNCHACIELHCLWDWKAFFAPHVHERFGGFATGQFGSWWWWWWWWWQFKFGRHVWSQHVWSTQPQCSTFDRPHPVSTEPQ